MSHILGLYGIFKYQKAGLAHTGQDPLKSLLRALFAAHPRGGDGHVVRGLAVRVGEAEDFLAQLGEVFAFACWQYLRISCVISTPSLSMSTMSPPEPAASVLRMRFLHHTGGQGLAEHLIGLAVPQDQSGRGAHFIEVRLAVEQIDARKIQRGERLSAAAEQQVVLTRLHAFSGPNPLSSRCCSTSSVSWLTRPASAPLPMPSERASTFLVADGLECGEAVAADILAALVPLRRRHLQREVSRWQKR